MENLARNLFGDADLVERLALRFEDARVPTARKIRGIAAEQQPLRAGDIEGAPEYDAQVEMRLFVTHPAIAARSIQVYVRA